MKHTKSSSPDPSLGAKKNYERGMHYKRPKWTKDTTTNYYQGFRLQVMWPLLKLGGFILVFAALHLIMGVSLLLSFFGCLLASTMYPYLVYAGSGFKYMVMPVMD